MSDTITLRSLLVSIAIAAGGCAAFVINAQLATFIIIASIVSACAAWMISQKRVAIVLGIIYGLCGSALLAVIGETTGFTTGRPDWSWEVLAMVTTGGIIGGACGAIIVKASTNK